MEEGSKRALEVIIESAFTRSEAFIAAPEVVAAILPFIIRTLDFEYGKGIVHSLEAIVKSLESANGCQIAEKQTDINSKIKGIRLAELFLGVMENSHVPTRISDAMLSAMTDVFNHDLTGDQKAHLTLIDDDRDPHYIDALFRAWLQNQQPTATVDLLQKADTIGQFAIDSNVSGVPTISDIPHSKPSGKRGQPKVEKRPAKPKAKTKRGDSQK